MIISHNGPQVSTGSSQIAAFNAMYSSAIGIDVHSTLMVACFQKGEFELLFCTLYQNMTKNILYKLAFAGKLAFAVITKINRVQ